MLTGQPNKKPWDKAIVLPAAVLALQSIPWFAVRLRMRALAPLMLLYILHDLTSSHRKVPAWERSAGDKMLISGCLFFQTYLLAHSLFYGNVVYPWFVGTTFGLFYMWVFVRLTMENKLVEIKILTLIALGALGIGAFMGASYLGDDISQNIIRDMTGGGASDWDTRDAVFSGVGGFGTVYSAGMLAPALYYAGFCSKWRPRLVFWMLGAILNVYAYRAGFSILMATMIFGLSGYALSFSLKRYSPYRTALIAMIVFILAVTLSPHIASFVVSPLTALSEMVTNENYAMRLRSIADGISGAGDEYALYRTSLMWRSWNVFLSHPFIGASYTLGLLGGHSFFFDNLAVGGLLGFLPYPIFIYFYFQYLNRLVFPLSPRSRILISTYFYMYLLCTFLNPLDSASVWASMFLILPGVSLFFTDSHLNRRRRPMDEKQADAE